MKISLLDESTLLRVECEGSCRLVFQIDDYATKNVFGNAELHLSQLSAIKCSDLQSNLDEKELLRRISGSEALFVEILEDRINVMLDHVSDKDMPKQLFIEFETAVVDRLTFSK